MKTKRFKQLLHLIDHLNSSQFRQLKEKVRTFESKDYVATNLETSFEKISCPHCNSTNKWRWGKRNDLQRYKCKVCRKTFNSLSGTPLARLRRKEQWLEYSICLQQGQSVRKAGIRCQIHYNTAFKWRHRFLDNAKSIKPLSLNGIVEADETYFLRSDKGSRKLVRKPRKRGGKASKRGLSKEQVCVLVCRDRNTNTIDEIFEHFNSDQLSDSLKDLLSKDALFCSDGKSVYKKFTRTNHLRHGCLNLSAGQRVIKDIVHIQNVNSYHSRLKEWLIRFHGVATKYLESYLAWFRELDEFSMQVKPETLLLRGKELSEYKVQPFIMT